MKNRFTVFVSLLFLFAHFPVFASDLVINIDPNPAIVNEPVRVSVVADFDIDNASLVLPDSMINMEKITSQLYRVNLLASEALLNKSHSLKVSPVKGKEFELSFSISGGSVFKHQVITSVPLDIKLIK